jgi:hypothetical protein
MRLPSVVAVLACCVFLAGCGSSAEPAPEDVDQAYDNAADSLADADFEDVGDTSQCTQDCSGHDAGFAWARDNGISDSSDCTGDSQSFVEGCQAYVDALDEEADEELSGDDRDE